MPTGYAHPRRSRRPATIQAGDRVRTYHRGLPTYATVLRAGADGPHGQRPYFVVRPDSDALHPFRTLNVQFFARPVPAFNTGAAR